VTKDRAGRFKVFGMPLEIRSRPEMPELVGSHVNADVPRKGVHNLLGYGRLTLATAALGDEERTIHVGSEAGQYVASIPSQAASYLIWHLSDDILLFAFRVPGGDVKDQRTTWTIRFAEVVFPAERAEVLRPEQRSEQDIDCDLQPGRRQIEPGPYRGR
jgi:hypothetical protein